MDPRRAQLGARQEETQLEYTGAWCQRVYGIVALRAGTRNTYPLLITCGRVVQAAWLGSLRAQKDVRTAAGW